MQRNLATTGRRVRAALGRIARRGVLALAIAGVTTTQARGGQIGFGTVSLIETNATDNLAYITVEGPYESRPACSTFARQRFVVDTALQGGRNSLANAFMARAMSKTVFMYGTGSCPPGGGDERLQFIGLWP